MTCAVADKVAVPPPGSVNVALQVWAASVVSELTTRLPHPVGFETELFRLAVMLKVTVTVVLNQPPHEPPGEQL
jgi:hypothetical protein